MAQGKPMRHSKQPMLVLLLTLVLASFGLAGCIHVTTPPPVVPSSPEDALFQNYLSAVSAKLYEQKFLIRPFYGAAKETSVVVVILLDAQGHALNSGIRQSSGSPDVDRTVIAMVSRASPFPPPPKELMKSEQLGMGIAIALPKTRREWREAFE